MLEMASVHLCSGRDNRHDDLAHIGRLVIGIHRGTHDLCAHIVDQIERRVEAPPEASAEGLLSSHSNLLWSWEGPVDSPAEVVLSFSAPDLAPAWLVLEARV